MPGSGGLRRAPKLIDRSFYGVYTDPSKPPVIGDLAGFEEGLSPVGGVTMALNAASQLQSFRCHTPGFSGMLRDGMGLFRFAGMSAVAVDPHRGGSGRLWPELMWWPEPWPHQPSRLYRRPSLSSSLQPIQQLRVTGSRVVGHALESIRRSRLTRSWTAVARAFRRWMLPTVERGPPGHSSV